MEVKIEKYNKDKEISYTFGAFPTFELVKKQAGKCFANCLSF